MTVSLHIVLVLVVKCLVQFREIVL
jgi:hypothetical protein